MKKIKICFFENNNLLWNYLKIHWKLILFFIIFWLILVIVVMSLTLIGTGVPFISDGSLVNSDYTLPSTPGGSSSGGTVSSSFVSVSSIYNHLFKSSGVIYFGLVTLVFINITLLREVSTSKISLWLTQPVSRMQIFISKYLLILLVFSIMYLQSFIVLISFSANAFDADEYFQNVLIASIQLFFYQVFLISLFFIISISLMENSILVNIICSLILSYLVIIWIMSFVLLVSQSDSKIMETFIRYIGPQCFLIDTLSQSKGSEYNKYLISEWVVGSTTYKRYVEALAINTVNSVSYTFTLLASIISSTLLSIFSGLMFKNKSFNI